jgi:two-component system chemotaxis response regulator CheY
MGTILIVDDSQFMRFYLKKNITLTEHEIVAEANNGREAIELYTQFSPDLVTMDITMPEMNGLDALRAIIKIDPNAKIIMCSAMGQQALIVEAIRSGAKDFIVKPFDQNRVVETIKKVLNGVPAGE